MKQVLLEMEDINLQRESERSGNTTRIEYVLDSYDESYIYNKVEQKNAQRDVCLYTFLAMAEPKGFQYGFLSYGEKKAGMETNIIVSTGKSMRSERLLI